MVLEHQAGMMNLITRGGLGCATGQLTGPAVSRSVTDLVDYMLFVDEAPIPGPLEGPTSFAKNFSARGPFDRKGRSLRQLDTRARLLKYPCSYMIYSEAFDALPDNAKSAVYARLWEVLSGKDTDKIYQCAGAVRSRRDHRDPARHQARPARLLLPAAERVLINAQCKMLNAKRKAMPCLALCIVHFALPLMTIRWRIRPARRRIPLRPVALELEVRARVERLRQVLRIVDDRDDEQPDVAVRMRRQAIEVLRDRRVLAVGNAVLPQVSLAEAASSRP